MTQATDSPTTIPVQLASRRRHAAILPAVQRAHATMISHLAQNTPNHIVGHFADRFDLMERRDHLRAIHAAVIAYTKAIVADSAEMAPIGYVKDETGFLQDAAAEIYDAFDNAIERMLEDQADAAE